MTWLVDMQQNKKSSASRERKNRNEVRDEQRSNRDKRRLLVVRSK
jgi:hypothetical protein